MKYKSTITTRIFSIFILFLLVYGVVRLIFYNAYGYSLISSSENTFSKIFEDSSLCNLDAARAFGNSNDSVFCYIYNDSNIIIVSKLHELQSISLDSILVQERRIRKFKFVPIDILELTDNPELIINRRGKNIKSKKALSLNLDSYSGLNTHIDKGKFNSYTFSAKKFGIAFYNEKPHITYNFNGRKVKSNVVFLKRGDDMFFIVMYALDKKSIPPDGVLEILKVNLDTIDK